jgi:hypothetical protein
VFFWLAPVFCSASCKPAASSLSRAHYSAVSRGPHPGSARKNQPPRPVCNVLRYKLAWASDTMVSRRRAFHGAVAFASCPDCDGSAGSRLYFGLRKWAFIR